MPCKCLIAVDITLFRTPDSSEGVRARRYFDKKGVACEDLDVLADERARQRMLELSGQIDRPVIVVDNQVLIGFDPAALDPIIPSFF